MPEDDRAFATRLARYCARNPVALERLTYDRTAKAVTYRSAKFDMPGWSHSITTNGDIIYLQSPAENLGYFVRVVPEWVKELKRAVDAANW